MAEPPMRVLWLTENYPPSRGGMAQSCDRIVDGLRRRGTAVDVAHLTRSLAPGWTRTEQHHGLLLTAQLGDDPEHGMHRLWTTVRAEHSRSPYTHVVAFGGAYPIHAAPVYAAWLPAPLVTLLRGNDFDTGVFSLRRRASLLDALRASAAVGVVSADALGRVKALVPGTKVRVIHNGIDLSGWSTLPSERERALGWRRANVAPGRRSVGLIGQLKQKKGALFFLDALATSGAAASFHVVLVGELEPAVREWLEGDAAAGCGLSWSEMPFLDRYELLGVFPACDIVALPSFYDGLPNVALEAAGLGIPLLCSDAGGLAELVDEQIGFSFTAGDIDRARSSIIAVAATTDDQLRALGREAARRVRKAYTSEAEVDGYTSLLSEVVSAR